LRHLGGPPIKQKKTTTTTGEHQTQTQILHPSACRLFEHVSDRADLLSPEADRMPSHARIGHPWIHAMQSCYCGMRYGCALARRDGRSLYRSINRRLDLQQKKASHVPLFLRSFSAQPVTSFVADDLIPARRYVEQSNRVGAMLCLQPHQRELAIPPSSTSRLTVSYQTTRAPSLTHTHISDISTS